MISTDLLRNVVYHPYVPYVLAGLLAAYILYTIYSFFFTPMQMLWEEPIPLNRHGRPQRVIGKVPPYFPNGWFKIMDSQELKKGQKEYVQFLGQHLVVFRGEDGNVAVLDAYCPHLGANMGVESKVVGNCIECPFHGWRFNSSGKCEHIPYSEGKIPEQAKVKSWPVLEVNGLILMYHHAEGTEPEWKPPVIPEIASKEYVNHGKFRCFVRCHVQEIPENGSDVAHLGVLHTPFRDWIPQSILRHHWSAAWQNHKNESQYYMTSISLTQSILLFGKTLPFTSILADINQVGPGIVQLTLHTSFGKIYIMESVTPVAPMLQHVEHVVFAPKNILYRPLAKVILQGFSGQFIRDMNVWHNKMYQHKPVLVKGDGPIAQFRRWYSQFYSENSHKVHESIECLSTYKVGNIPTVYYVPDFLSKEEETFLLAKIYAQPSHKWTILKNRRLQNHGGSPHLKGMFAEPLPDFLTQFSQKITKAFPDFFPKAPNHVLINEYLPNQGIMPHKDGPVYLPFVVIISLESSIVINFKPDPHEENNPCKEEFCMVLEPRSLIVFTDDVYHHYLHSIEETEKEEISSSSRPFCNLHVVKSVKEGETITRQKRVSLTYRVVAKTFKNILPVGKK